MRAKSEEGFTGYDNEYGYVLITSCSNENLVYYLLSLLLIYIISGGKLMKRNIRVRSKSETNAHKFRCTTIMPYHAADAWTMYGQCVDNLWVMYGQTHLDQKYFGLILTARICRLYE